MSAEIEDCREHFEHSGAIHIHSAYSDGSGEVSEIVNDAREAALDFIVLTDHNTLKAKDVGWEGRRGGLLVMGDGIAWTRGLQAEILVSASGQIRVVRNGVTFATSTGAGLAFDVDEPGVYRTEVKLDGRPWIYSNPLYVRSQP